MKIKTIVLLFAASFLVLCGLMIIQTVVFERPAGAAGGLISLEATVGSDNDVMEESSDVPELAQMATAKWPEIYINDSEEKTVIIGAKDPNTEDPETGFRFQVILTTKGAAIAKATFSDGEGKGFDDRNFKDPKPLVILSPVKWMDGSETFPLANSELIFTERKTQMRLNKLNWKAGSVVKAADGSESVSFEAVVEDSSGGAVLKFAKTYKVIPGSFHLDIDMQVENFSSDEQKISLNLTGPLGLGTEDSRSDMRKAIGGSVDSKGQFVTERKDIKKLHNQKDISERRLVDNKAAFVWAASVNKYFAAILVPLAEEGENYPGWIRDELGICYDPDGEKKLNGDEAVGVNLKLMPITLAPAGSGKDLQEYDFLLYLGPKDKRIFDKNERYGDLGFVHVIDFMACFCCPAAIISPLAFGILWIMEWMYSFIGNYGVVIIILVLLIRLIIHPLTKKSQVSMSKFSKLAPMAEEIKKKYAKDKVEMNRQLMDLYRKQGASPIFSMLPMFVQMPVWIALYSAIYASVALRGAPFLPFWITDLSAPDALMHFSTITVPLLGWQIDSLNLLPILMGLAFFFQQKLMPSQAAASSNPQMAQQQKMMMFMMPILFPVMLYKAPSGLNLYIMASTFAGVIEQFVIKKHIREKEELEEKGMVEVTSKTGGKVKKKKPKPFYKNM